MVDKDTLMIVATFMAMLSSLLQIIKTLPEIHKMTSKPPVRRFMSFLFFSSINLLALVVLVLLYRSPEPISRREVFLVAMASSIPILSLIFVVLILIRGLMGSLGALADLLPAKTIAPGAIEAKEH